MVVYGFDTEFRKIFLITTVNCFCIVNRVLQVGAPSTMWWTQLASAIAGGLAFATILTLVLTPCLLVLGDRLPGRRKVVVPEKAAATA